MVLLTMVVSIKSLRPSCTDDVCNKATPSQIAFFYLALYILAVGAGGTKPNISTFGADQFDDLDSHERTLKASFFNWWMFSTFLGALMATLGLVYVQENVGWGVGYGIPTMGLAVSLVVFYMGTPNYRHKARKSNSPAAEMARVWAAAIANRRLKLPDDPAELYELEPQHYLLTGKRRLHYNSSFRSRSLLDFCYIQTMQAETCRNVCSFVLAMADNPVNCDCCLLHRFLDRAAIKESDKPCTVTQVQETKLVLGMTVIWFATIVPSTIWAQVNTLFVKQGTTMDRRLGHGFLIPAASLGSFITVSMLLTVPLYDRYFVPFMRRRTGNPRGITLLQRLGIGFGFHVVLTLVAYAVELRRTHVIRQSGVAGPGDVVPMTIFWLLPQYVLLGIGDVFNAIGLLEFFYDQSPEDLQSLGTTFFTSGIGVGNFLNSLLVTVVDRVTRAGGGKSWIGNNINDSHLDYYYGLLMSISAINLAIFVWVSSKYKYKEEALEVAEGKVVCLQMEGKVMDAPPASLGVQV
ncbi:hypothetical protein BHE74_00036469 [Ensete ventricosum]|uniref:Uncharacterized protein n=1 Tax=Ensete ventricosum TaxID=4639 RepID=A0A444DB90_ENSVE|nr:hypothetical protein B296_00016881 [Ensete ventricosum]RWV95384.1 hypothetical protein GW17_00041994 [Ensete ventricosum]RWW56787.1 hypothetical protein BHE74_00036469 [Ensete ventricosum]RZR84562.1 hypothetical protein BHM03_00011415 [Ensete ventricosum]